MNKFETLNVWYEQSHVGMLWENEQHQIGFEYDTNWRAQGFNISQQLPLSEKNYSPESGKAHRFFANLLPEANARTHILRHLKIADTDFALLKTIGGECAGALSILPERLSPQVDAHYHKITEEELYQMTLRKGAIINFNNDKQRPRLSLAGAQDKCPVLFKNEEYFLPKNSSPSTHIIKFDIKDFRNVPAYEHFFKFIIKKYWLANGQYTATID